MKPSPIFPKLFPAMVATPESSKKLSLYHLNKFNNTVSERYGSGIMIKHIDIKILAWYYALRTKELRQSSMEVHRRIIDSFFEWTKN